MNIKKNNLNKDLKMIKEILNINRKFKIKFKKENITLINENEEIYELNNKEILNEVNIIKGEIDILLIPYLDENNNFNLIKEEDPIYKNYKEEKGLFEKNIEKGDILTISNYNKYELTEIIYIDTIYLNYLNLNFLKNKKINNSTEKKSLIYNLSTKEFELISFIKIYDKKGRDFRFENEETKKSIIKNNIQNNILKKAIFKEDFLEENIIDSKEVFLKIITFDKKIKKTDLF
jgi:hypothetical protein